MTFSDWTMKISLKMKRSKRSRKRHWMIWKRSTKMPSNHWKFYTNTVIWATVTLAIRKSSRNHWSSWWAHGAAENHLSSITWPTTSTPNSHWKLVWQNHLKHDWNVCLIFFPRIFLGAEPSLPYFNILTYGEKEEVLDGTQLSADWTFSGLQKFGQGLTDRLRGLKLPSNLLKKVSVIEMNNILNCNF